MRRLFSVFVLTTLAIVTSSAQAPRTHRLEATPDTLVSIAGHVAVTQLVDRTVYGVHVRMPKATFK
jgi:hypothetical protein